MQLSIQRLRWILMAAAVLLAIVLAVFIGYGRYRALKAYRQILSHAGVTLTRDSNGVTYSQSSRGKKIFTIRAKSESSLGNGKYSLHDAEMLLYDREGKDADHIYGSEIEYDENEGIARAKGQVLMDLKAPEGLASSSAHAGAPKATVKPVPVIHVRTSGLIYMRKLGVAATDQQVNFTYGDMQCTSLGAEFNSGQNTLHLLAKVQMNGLAHGKPLHLTAVRADMDRNANIAHLEHPMVTSDDRSARADAATLTLRRDGSVEHLLGVGHVALRAATREVTSDRLDATLNSQSIPQAARLSGAVVLDDRDPTRSSHGSASQVDMVFDAQGSPTTIVATGRAKLAMTDRRASTQGLARSMDGDKITAVFRPGHHNERSQITQLHLLGAAHVSGDSIAHAQKSPAASATEAPLKTIQVAADDLDILFAPSTSGESKPQALRGIGHTQLQQDAPRGEQQLSSGDTLQMTFTHSVPSAVPESAAVSLSSAVQTGHVSIRTRAASKSGSSQPGAVSTGSANVATFDGNTDVLTLSGDARLYGDDASLLAPTIALDERTQNADASGGVQATVEKIEQNAGDASQGASRPGAVTHVLASTAHFDHDPRLATFHGTDTQPARLWQDGSQVEAATFLFDGLKRTFSARPAVPGTQIHATFASNPTTAKPGKPELAATILRVAASRMDYNDPQRVATFSGGVAMDGTIGEVRGQRAAIFLTAAPKTNTGALTSSPVTTSLPVGPSPMGGTVDRAVVYGDVQLDEPGRHGTGDQLLYTAATGTYVLTGTPADPPHIVDARQGNVTGTMLLFGNAGSTIVVSGDPSAPNGKGGRVRSETQVSPGKEERQ